MPQNSSSPLLRFSLFVPSSLVRRPGLGGGQRRNCLCAAGRAARGKLQIIKSEWKKVAQPQYRSAQAGFQAEFLAAL
jgi:hypothetical protein